MESTAKTKSLSSMHTKQSSRGVATVFPLPPIFVKKRSPSYSSTAPTSLFDILRPSTKQKMFTHPTDRSHQIRALLMIYALQGRQIPGLDLLNSQLTTNLKECSKIYQVLSKVHASDKKNIALFTSKIDIK